jgi:L-histidine Nalpha-methyltransferase
MITSDIQLTDIAKAVEEGFAQSPKRLPSWLFYDEAGDKIFQAIMHIPEYYLTACEYEILQMNKARMLRHFAAHKTPFNLIELGAGDGLKTEILLKYFSEQKAEFVYSPVDVSQAVLAQLQQRLKKSVPQLSIQGIHGKYDEALDQLYRSEQRKVYLFMGANIGNFSLKEAPQFVTTISDSMQCGDQLMIGFDLKKDPRLIQAAYDDPHGITRDFNMNLLVRLNRELGAQFQLDQFKHYPYYNPETGVTKSYLVSLKDQDVYFEGCDKSFHFNRWEVIHTEISQKYDQQMIEDLFDQAGLEIVEFFYDCKYYFCDVLVTKSC